MADGLPATPERAAEMDWDAAARILADAAKGADDGEIFAEDTRAESFHWDDGRLKSASFDATQGFGLRVVAGERAGYGHASVLETEAVSRAAEAAAAVKQGHDGALDVSPARVNRQLYADFDPIEAPAFTDKTNLLAEIDAYCRAKDPRVVQVSATLAGARRGLTILRPDGAKLQWVTARQATPALPFLCGDLTPRALRVPEGDLRTHPNGVTGVLRLTVLVADPGDALRRYGALLGPSVVIDMDPGVLPAQARPPAFVATFVVGTQRVVLVSPRAGVDADSSLAERLAGRGEGVIALRLTGPALGALAPERTHGAAIVVGG